MPLSVKEDSADQEELHIDAYWYFGVLVIPLRYKLLWLMIMQYV